MVWYLIYKRMMIILELIFELKVILKQTYELSDIVNACRSYPVFV